MPPSANRVMNLQRWQKRGLVFDPTTGLASGRTYAQVPTPYVLADQSIRVYFGSRDAEKRTATLYLELNREAPCQVTRVSEAPVLSLGKLGSFDDCGVMPSCVVAHGEELRLYYTGWNTSTTVPYRNSIGVALSNDGGHTFQRPFEGPILDRTAHEPHFCATPFVLYENGVWRMWYLSCTEWTEVANRPEAQYLIRYAESDDGLEWRRPGTIAIDYERPDEALARPWVVKDSDGYHMWYSSRLIRDYRANAQNGYRLGYATSSDGIGWKRQDDWVDLPVSSEGWDAQMIAYPAVIDLRGGRCMLYNGSGFGATGFGLAELQPASM